MWSKRFWSALQRWRGVALIAAAVVATVWMAFGNQLVLYIHPRYIVFSVIMAALALVLIVASIAGYRPHPDDDDVPRRGWPRLFSLAAIVVAGAIATAMVVLPPATLTSATASQRDINSSSVGAPAQSVSEVATAPAAAFASFTVVDWASLLRQTSDLSFYANKPVDVTGFVTADPDDPQNVFYVSRFVITCCAVDAQPAGVPVYLENWPDTYKIDDWVTVTGGFAANQSSHSTQPIAIDPKSVTAVEQPSDPYLY